MDKANDGAPERIRTSDPQIRSLVLYPAELRAHPATSVTPRAEAADLEASRRLGNPLSAPLCVDVRDRDGGRMARADNGQSRLRVAPHRVTTKGAPDQGARRSVIRVSSDGRPSRTAKPGHRPVPLLT